MKRWTFSPELLARAAAESISLAGVLRRLGVPETGFARTRLRRDLAAYGIDTGHFTRAPARRRGPTGPALLRLRTPDEGRTPGRRLRRALLAGGVAERCGMCGTGPQWNGRPLTLEVDHVDGRWWDDRPGNLRLLCPNCHAVTDTYRGRKRPS